METLPTILAICEGNHQSVTGCEGDKFAMKKCDGCGLQTYTTNELIHIGVTQPWTGCWHGWQALAKPLTTAVMIKDAQIGRAIKRLRFVLCSKFSGQGLQCIMGFMKHSYWSDMSPWNAPCCYECWQWIRGHGVIVSGPLKHTKQYWVPEGCLVGCWGERRRETSLNERNVIVLWGWCTLQAIVWYIQ